VRYDQTELLLNPFVYCYRSGCVDGSDNDPPSVGSPEELFIFVPVDEFTDLSVMMASGDGCYTGRDFSASIAPMGGGWWSVRPRGPAAEYTVNITARGDGAGDMVATLFWRTPSDEPLPAPQAQLGFLSEELGGQVSYGLALLVTGLESAPTAYSSTITVSGAGTQPLTVDALPVDEPLCQGALRSEAEGRAALGGEPYTFRVELTLAGVTHVATATYPEDKATIGPPVLPLSFEPPLR
jgi:hypothetical protein